MCNRKTKLKLKTIWVKLKNRLKIIGLKLWNKTKKLYKKGKSFVLKILKQIKHFLCSNLFVYIVMIVFYATISNYIIKYDIAHSCNESELDLISTFAQIQVALASLIVTMMSITTSLKQISSHNMNIKDIFKLRKHFYLNLINTTLILLLLTTGLTVCLIFNLFYYSLLNLILSIIVCFWFCIQDLPLIFGNDKSLIKLIKKNLRLSTLETDTNLVYRKNFDKIVFLLIQEKGLAKVYKLLKKSKKTDNTKLLEYLTTLIQSHISDELLFTDNFDENLNFSRVSFSLIKDVQSLFKDDTILADFQSESLSLYTTRIIYALHNNYDNLDKNTQSQFDTIIHIMFVSLFSSDSKVSEICLNSLRSLSRWTLLKEEMWCIKLIKEQFNLLKHTFTKNNNMLIIFSEISYILYVYYNYEKLISEKFKVNIKTFINESYINESNERISSWNSLFKTYLSNFNINFEKLNNYIDSDKWEFMIINESKCCIMTQRTLFNWWFLCLLSSSSKYRYDTSYLDKMNEKCKDLVSWSLNSYFNQKHFTLENINTDNFCEFFDIKNKKLSAPKNLIDSLFKFKNNYNKEKELKEASENAVNDEKLDELKSHIEKELTSKLKNSITYTPNLDLENTQPVGIYNIEEMFDFESTKNLYSDMLENCFKEEFYRKFSEHFKGKNIYTYKMTNKDVNQIVKMNPSFAMEDALFDIDDLTNINDSNKDKLHKLRNTINYITSDIVIPQDSYYFTKDAIKFNFSIDIFELNTLTEEQLIRCVDSKKADDEKYYHNGIQYTYEEMKDLLKDIYFTIKIFIKYDISIDDNKIKLLSWYDENK